MIGLIDLDTQFEWRIRLLQQKHPRPRPWKTRRCWFRAASSVSKFNCILRPKESKRNQNCNVVCILYRLQAIPLGEEMLHGAASNWMQIQNFPKIVCVAKIVALASGPDSMQDSITEGLRSSSGVVTSRHRLASQPTNAQHSVPQSTSTRENIWHYVSLMIRYMLTLLETHGRLCVEVTSGKILHFLAQFLWKPKKTSKWYRNRWNKRWYSPERQFSPEAMYTESAVRR